MNGTALLSSVFTYLWQFTPPLLQIIEKVMYFYPSEFSLVCG